MNVRIRESLMYGGHEVLFLTRRRSDQRKCYLVPVDRAEGVDEHPHYPGYAEVLVDEAVDIGQAGFTTGKPGGSVYLPDGALEAILEVGLGLVGPEGAQRDAIEDARKTRDQLLDVVLEVARPKP